MKLIERNYLNLIREIVIVKEKKLKFNNLRIS